MSNVSIINGRIDGTETCVVCGRDIPEGSQVCVICGNTEPKDMVEVVRCKDCKESMQVINQCGDCYCTLHKGWFHANAFCSYGERRGKEE